MRAILNIGLLWLILVGGALGELLKDPITFEKEVGRGYERIRFTNTSSAPVSIKLNLQLTNTSVDGPRDLLCIPAKATLAGPTFRPIHSGQSWTYRFNYLYNFGDFRISSPDQPFELPWSEGESFKTGQAFGGALSHQGTEGYAVDFPMPIGTPIHAARRGLVVLVVEHFTEGGWRQELRDKGNQITIAHEDGSLSRYMHLRPQGALVELGQWVESGDLIGYSGNIGYSNGPHLHFDVSRPGRDLVTQTIPFRLVVEGVEQEPVEGRVYTR